MEECSEHGTMGIRQRSSVLLIHHLQVIKTRKRHSNEADMQDQLPMLCVHRRCSLMLAPAINVVPHMSTPVSSAVTASVVEC